MRINTWVIKLKPVQTIRQSIYVSYLLLSNSRLSTHQIDQYFYDLPNFIKVKRMSSISWLAAHFEYLHEINRRILEMAVF